MWQIYVLVLTICLRWLTLPFKTANLEILNAILQVYYNGNELANYQVWNWCHFCVS